MFSAPFATFSLAALRLVPLVRQGGASATALYSRRRPHRFKYKLSGGFAAKALKFFKRLDCFASCLSIDQKGQSLQQLFVHKRLQPRHTHVFDPTTNDLLRQPYR